MGLTRTFVHKGTKSNPPKGEIIIPWRRNKRGQTTTEHRGTRLFTARANRLARARYLKANPTR